MTCHNAVLPTGVVSEPPVKSITSPVQATGQDASHSTTASQPVEAPRVRVATQPVEAPTARPAMPAIQPVEASGATATSQTVGFLMFCLFPPTGQSTASQDVTSTTEMSHGQFTGPAEQTTSSKKPHFALSLTGAVHSRLRTLIWTRIVSLPTPPGQHRKRGR